jgi:glutamine synthetase
VDYVHNGDYNASQAIKVAADILFHNSNSLYRLKMTPEYTPGIPSGALSTNQSHPRKTSDALDVFIGANPEVEYVWMQWVDYTATVRVRMFPIDEFTQIARQQRRIGISLAATSILQDDTVTVDGSTTGQFFLVPDLSSLCLNGSMMKPATSSATVMTFWHSEKNEPLDVCPRAALQTIVENIEAEHNISIKCGFEIEVVFLTPTKDDQTGKPVYTPATTNHSWSQMTAETRRLVPLLEEVHRTLANMGILLEQFHAESAPGQFEFILPPSTPLATVDSLIASRQVIAAVAERHGLRATLHPRPIASGPGSAAHAHLSISPVTREENFLAGILAHYPAIIALTLSQDTSYDRVCSGIWSGSEWIAWGLQNRETPVRKIEPGHWEIKSLDGIANPYLAIAAILAGGYLGLKEGTPLTMQECIGTSYLSHK